MTEHTTTTTNSGGSANAGPPTTTGQGRAVGYLRVSTALQADQGLGLDVQRERVRTFANEQGFAIVDVVTEQASGGVLAGEIHSWEHRPRLLELLARAERGEYEVLLVARLDRLSRDHATLVALERLLQRHGVRVISTAEENGDGPIAELIRGQLALFAQFERSLIRERLAAGKARGKALGRHVHGRTPYGYRSSSPGMLEPDPDTAPIVERIFKTARAGTNPARIARELNADGIPAPAGKEWRRSGVVVILGNVAYVGAKYGVTNAHPRIVSRRMFNDAQRALAQHGRTSSSEAER